MYIYNRQFQRFNMIKKWLENHEMDSYTSHHRSSVVLRQASEALILSAWALNVQPTSIFAPTFSPWSIFEIFDFFNDNTFVSKIPKIVMSFYGFTLTTSLMLVVAIRWSNLQKYAVFKIWYKKLWGQLILYLELKFQDCQMNSF